MRSILVFLSLGMVVCLGNAPRKILGVPIEPSSDYHGSVEKYNGEDDVDNKIDIVRDIERPEDPLPLESKFMHSARLFFVNPCKIGYRPDSRGRCRQVLDLDGKRWNRH